MFQAAKGFNVRQMMRKSPSSRWTEFRIICQKTW